MGNVAADINLTTGHIDPFGSTNAIKFNYAGGSGPSDYPHIRLSNALIGTTNTHTASVYIK